MDSSNILGCFVSRSSLYHDATENEKTIAKEKGDLFVSYVWKEPGIAKILGKLNYHDYGQDIEFILFKFYVNPIPYLLQALKPVENYRRNEKSIGIPIVVTDKNFFDKNTTQRYLFIKQALLEKLELLEAIVKKKKFDTNISLLKADLSNLL